MFMKKRRSIAFSEGCQVATLGEENAGKTCKITVFSSKFVKEGKERAGQRRPKRFVIPPKWVLRDYSAVVVSTVVVATPFASSMYACQVPRMDSAFSAGVVASA